MISLEIKFSFTEYLIEESPDQYVSKRFHPDPWVMAAAVTKRTQNNHFRCLGNWPVDSTVYCQRDAGNRIKVKRLDLCLLVLLATIIESVCITCCGAVHHWNKHQSSQETYAQMPSMTSVPDTLMSAEITWTRQNKHCCWASHGRLHGCHRRDTNWGVNRQKPVLITDDVMED